jgi:Zn-finger nucleic acid-binding protein
MICPVCNIPLTQLNISGVVIDECSESCHGLWFDSQELSRLDELGEGAGETLQRLLSYPRGNDDRSRKLTCPRCSTALQRKSYYYRSTIFIDDCYNCGGVWLDAGELAAVRENFKNREEREAICDQMLSENPEFKAFLQKKNELEQKTAVIRQKGLLKNLANLAFFKM